MKSIVRWLTAIAATFLLAAAANAADPFLGTWRLDLAKSTIANNPGVKSKEFVLSPTAEGVMITETLELMAGGEKQVTHLPYAYGKPVPQAGPGFDALLVEKTDDRTALWTVTLKGKVLSQLQVTVSPDGKEMAFRYVLRSSDPTGETLKDRMVYVRQ
ncbi:MAG: hypothetical protein JWL96_3841 [Sphingomonas bacterium]|uniref:hypothetical protein n=1 Tax=Sphingomonas bacterium TaxID=1895847 RepID=UPI0026295B46|nr:hypothetical protein [Sphingomonas bacterium]MDB5711771.1 hypothetical protein [Sphingomonas bacterium]